MNVTWRGKSFVGTLLDCSRYDWAPPRNADSPLLELTPNAKNRNGTKRRNPLAVNTGNGGNNGHSKAKTLKVYTHWRKCLSLSC